MIYLLSFLIGIPSPVFFFFFNAEAWTISTVLLTDAKPLGIAVCVASGQLVGYNICYFKGPWLLERLPGLAKRLETMDIKKYRNISYGALFMGALVSFPPTLFFTLLRKRFHYHYGLWLTILFVCRMARFCLLALLPQTFASYFVQK